MRYLLWVLLLFSGSAGGQTRVPADTCACKSLMQFWSLYETDKDYGPVYSENRLGFNGFVKQKLHLDIDRPDVVWNYCQDAWASAIPNNKYDYGTRAMKPGVWWGDMAAAYLENFGRTEMTLVPASLVCQQPVFCDEPADPFLCRAVIRKFMLQHAKEFRRLIRETEAKSFNEVLATLCSTEKAVHTKNARSLLQKLEQELMATLHHCSQAPVQNLQYYCMLAMMADDMHIPGCLPKDSATDQYLLHHAPYPGVYTRQALLDSLLVFLKNKNRAKTKQLADYLHQIPDACQGSYRKPASWYLRNAWEGDTFPVTMPVQDSAELLLLRNFLDGIMRKPYPDQLLKNGFYLKPVKEPGGMEKYGIRQFADSKIFGMAKRDQLFCHWNTGVVATDRFQSVLPMVIADSAGFSIPFSICLPLHSRMQQWPFFMHTLSLKKVAENAQNQFFTLTVLNYLNLFETPDSAYTLVPNNMDFTALISTQKIDTLTLLLQVGKPSARTRENQKPGKRKRTEQKTGMQARRRE